MKTSINILLLLIALLYGAAQSSYAQGDTTLQQSPLYRNAASNVSKEVCANTRQTSRQDVDSVDLLLQDIEQLYTAGKYDEVLLKSQQLYDNHHLSKSENLQRLKYTIAAYKDFGYDREADSAAKLYLMKDPFFTVQDDDPVSLQEVLKNYYTKPKYSVWMALGKKEGELYTDTIRSIIDTASRVPDYRIEAFTIQLGFEYRPLKIFSISIAPSLTNYDFERTIDRSDIATFIYKESSQVLSVPLFLEMGMYFGREVFVPSIYAGAQIKYMLRSKYAAYTDARGTYTEIPEMTKNTNEKNRFNYSILGGIRLNYNHRRITYFADIGVTLDMMPYNDPKKIFSNYDLLYQNFYVPDVFRLIEYSVKLGIKVNLQYKTIAKFNYGY